MAIERDDPKCARVRAVVYRRTSLNARIARTSRALVVVSGATASRQQNQGEDDDVSALRHQTGSPLASRKERFGKLAIWNELLAIGRRSGARICRAGLM
jgi:hypothetical protein